MHFKRYLLVKQWQYIILRQSFEFINSLDLYIFKAFLSYFLQLKQCSLNAHNRKWQNMPTHLWEHRIVWVGRTFKGHLVQSPLQ